MQPRPPIIVMDLEWTAWEGSRKRHWSGPGEEMEIVQIGAVKLADAPDLREIDTFEILVRPRINPTLDSYFTGLTGITQDRLDREGLDLKPALALFSTFVGSTAALCGFGDELYHVAWNCRLYGMTNPFAGKYCQDVRPGVLSFFGAAPSVNSSELPQLLDFTPPGRAHQGLADSRCVAEALRRARAGGRF